MLILIGKIGTFMGKIEEKYIKKGK